MFRRLRFMLRKELIQTFRDPRMMFVILVVPVFQTLIFGYAVTTDVNRVETGIVDLANTAASRAATRLFISSGIFIPTYMNSYADAWDAMDQGKIQAMILINPEGLMQFVTDGSRGISAGVTAGYAASILSRNQQPPIRIESRAWARPFRSQASAWLMVLW